MDERFGAWCCVSLAGEGIGALCRKDWSLVSEGMVPGGGGLVSSAGRL